MPEDTPETPRAFWSGTLSFGLVTVPVNLFPANRPAGVHFRMLDPDGTPLRRRYFCSQDDRELSPDELVRGYEIAPDEYVVVTDEELEALEPRKSREIDLRAFVDKDQIDPRYFEHSYFLTPDGSTNKAYRLLAEAMERQGQAGIATFVMRTREYLVAILSEGGVLRAETLRFADELRSPEDVGLDASRKPDKKRVSQFAAEIRKRKAARLRPSQLKDEHAERVANRVEQKRRRGKGTVKVEPESEEDGEVIDLMDVLRRSLATGSTDKKRSAAARGSKKKSPPQRKRTPQRRAKSAKKKSASRRKSA